MTNYMMGSGDPVRARPGRPGRAGGRSAAAGSACGGRQRATSDRAREDSEQFPPRLGWGCTLGIFSSHPILKRGRHPGAAEVPTSSFLSLAKLLVGRGAGHRGSFPFPAQDGPI